MSFRSFASRSSAPGSVSTQVKIKGPSQTEQIAAGMNQGPGINTQLDMRRDDFIREKLFDQGEQPDTNMLNEVRPGWVANPAFQKDFAADTWANRILLQDPNINQRANAIVDGLDQQKFNVSDLSTADLNLANGRLKQNRVNNVQAKVNDRLSYLEGTPNPQFDEELNAIKLQDTDAMARANQINNLVKQGNITPADLPTADLALMQGFGVARARNRETFAFNNWNNTHPNNQVNVNEFFDRRDNSDEKFNNLKNERGVLGEGAFGAVVPGDTDRTVMKLQGPASDVWTNGSISPSDAPVEAENLLQLRNSNFTPNVHSLETLPDGSTILEMDNLAKNYTTLSDLELAGTLTPKQLQKINIQRYQQHGMAALKGFELNDRHSGNVMINKTTNRPIQVDFGMASMSKLESDVDKAATIATEASNGMLAAGMPEEADLLFGLVKENITSGNIPEALSIAKQGFAQLQKIKKPVNAPSANEFLQSRMPKVNSLLADAAVRF